MQKLCLNIDFHMQMYSLERWQIIRKPPPNSTAVRINTQQPTPSVWRRRIIGAYHTPALAARWAPHRSLWPCTIAMARCRAQSHRSQRWRRSPPRSKCSGKGSDVDGRPAGNAVYHTRCTCHAQAQHTARKQRHTQTWKISYCNVLVVIVYHNHNRQPHVPRRINWIMSARRVTRCKIHWIPNYYHKSIEKLLKKITLATWIVIRSAGNDNGSHLIENTYLVNTRHKSVADSIVNCCDRADWDFCMARCRSFCRAQRMYCDCGHWPSRPSVSTSCRANCVYLRTYFPMIFWPANSWEKPVWRGSLVVAIISVENDVLELRFALGEWADRTVGLTVRANGMVVTSSRMKWNDRICCQMLPL